MIKRLAVSSALIALASVAGCGEGSGGGRQFRSVGTAGTGGIYYPIGGAIASRLSLRDSTSQYTAEVTGGSVENINRLNARQMDLGIAFSQTIYDAYNGVGEYDQPVSGLRIVAPLYPNVTHIVVPEGSDAADLTDVRGGRVSVGSAGSGTEQFSRQLLAAHDITYDDIDVRYLTFTESASALRDGAIDAAIISVGYPAAAVLEATTTGGARLLPLSDAALTRMMTDYPYYMRSEIPGGSYPGVDDPLPTLALMNWFIAMDDLDASVVEHLLNILNDEKEDLTRVHRMVAQVELSALDTSPIPLHAATESWLERNP